MKGAFIRSCILAVALLLSMLSPGSRVQQTRAQTPTGECADATDLPAETGPVSPRHVGRLAETYSKETVGEYTYVTVGSIICVDAGTPIMPDRNSDPSQPESFYIQQFGTTAVSVVRGSLDVQLLAACVGIPCTATAPIARIGHVGSNNQVTWTDLTVGGPAETVASGDIAIFSEVTIMITAGPEQTLVTTTGSYKYKGSGSGCPAACWQMP